MTNANEKKDRKMTKKALKEKAQDHLLLALSSAFYSVADNDQLSDTEKDEMLKELEKQAQRIEKLFGYEPGSFQRW